MKRKANSTTPTEKFTWSNAEMDFGTVLNSDAPVLSDRMFDGDTSQLPIGAFKDAAAPLEPFTPKVGDVSNLEWLATPAVNPQLPKDPYNSRGDLARKTAHYYYDLGKRKHEAAIESDEVEEEFDPDSAKEAIRKAMRDCAAGKPLDQILNRVKLAMGTRTDLFKKVAAKIHDDYGLLGTVFIRASAYPGLRNGEWVSEIKKVARNAQYIITSDPLAAQKVGKIMVSDVPWGEAYSHYSGRVAKLASAEGEKGKKESLRRAFLAKEQESIRVAENKPQELKRLKPIEPESPIENLGQKRAALKIVAQVERLAKMGMLSSQDVEQFRAMDAPREVMLAKVHQIVSARRSASQPANVYTGIGWGMKAAGAILKAVDNDTPQHEYNEALWKGARVQLARWVKRGSLTQQEADWVLKKASNPDDLYQLANAVIQRAPGERAMATPPAQKAADYQGASFKAHAPEAPKTPVLSREAQLHMKLASESGIRVSEFQKLAAWLRLQMAKGQAGIQLDTVLRRKFASALIKAAAPVIQDLRSRLEGLSGIAFVDTGAYASCDQGAQIHRANKIKFAKSNSKCATCVHKNANSTCTKYNKPLVDALPERQAKLLQAKVLKLANSQAPKKACVPAPDFELGGEIPLELAAENQGSLDVSFGFGCSNVRDIELEG